MTYALLFERYLSHYLIPLEAQELSAALDEGLRRFMDTQASTEDATDEDFERAVGDVKKMQIVTVSTAAEIAMDSVMVREAFNASVRERIALWQAGQEKYERTELARLKAKYEPDGERLTPEQKKALLRRMNREDGPDDEMPGVND